MFFHNFPYIVPKNRVKSPESHQRGLEIPGEKAAKLRRNAQIIQIRRAERR